MGSADRVRDGGHRPSSVRSARGVDGPLADRPRRRGRDCPRADGHVGRAELGRARGLPRTRRDGGRRRGRDGRRHPRRAGQHHALLLPGQEADRGAARERARRARRRPPGRVQPPPGDRGADRPRRDGGALRGAARPRLGAPRQHRVVGGPAPHRRGGRALRRAHGRAAGPPVAGHRTADDARPARAGSARWSRPPAGSSTSTSR